jgi:AraC-like DNA-binding protein
MGVRHGLGNGDGKLMDDTWQVRLFRVENSAYDSIDLHNRTFPYWSISFVKEGDVEISHGDMIRTARSGQVMIHAPGIPFSERATVPGFHQWLHMEAYNSFQVDLFRLYPINEVVTLQDPSAFSAIFDRMSLAWKRKDLPFQELELSGLGLQLIHLLLQNWHLEGSIRRSFQPNKNDERLDKVITYLHTALREKITRKKLAELVHLNPNYLDKVFSEKFQLNPMQMLRELRLKQVRRMLETSNYTLAEIAEQCGLGDAPYLTQQFAKRYSINPGKYRQQVRLADHTYYKSP